MKKLVLFLSFLLLSLGACQNDSNSEALPDNICGFTDPLQELPWHKNLTENKGNCLLYTGAKIYTYEYQNQQVFYLSNAAFTRMVTCIFVLYDCEGKDITPKTQQEWADFEKNRKNELLLWEKK
ncbi:MAG: hypothetical protein H7Y04_01900 [Verrucomicrobia bacterium]|nr:hypothetical protein [Cytophagales bacterium]